eukprot:s1423_g9.t1
MPQTRSIKPYRAMLMKTPLESGRVFRSFSPDVWGMLQLSPTQNVTPSQAYSQSTPVAIGQPGWAFLPAVDEEGSETGGVAPCD